MDKLKDNEIIDLLKKRYHIVSEILTATERASFDISQIKEEEEAFAEVEEFQNYYFDREVIFKKLNNINAELGVTRESILGKISDKSFEAEAQRLIGETSELLNKIILKDKENLENGQKLIDYIKSNFKNFNQTRNIFTKYNSNIVLNDGYYFDKKN